MLLMHFMYGILLGLEIACVVRAEEEAKKKAESVGK